MVAGTVAVFVFISRYGEALTPPASPGESPADGVVAAAATAGPEHDGGQGNQEIKNDVGAFLLAR